MKRCSPRGVATAAVCGLALLLQAAPCAAQAAAAPDAAVLSGQRTLTLYARDGSRLRLGTVTFSPRADGRSGFTLALDSAPLRDHFLSMREFKCLDGQGEILCHVPYPYPQPATVSPGDFAWLEHALLFMFKTPSEFGAKLWNGVYFALRATPQGLEGRPQAVDLNHISAPPAKPDVPPFRPALRDDIAPGARWFNRLTVE